MNLSFFFSIITFLFQNNFKNKPKLKYVPILNFRSQNVLVSNLGQIPLLLVVIP